METKTIVEICPTIEDLGEEAKDFRKVHTKKSKSDKCNEYRYYCPMKTCKYSKCQQQFLKSIRLLKQHFRKMHKKKDFFCEKCGKQFAIESLFKQHEVTCGYIYKCYCNAEYNSYEAFTMHTSRNKHIGVNFKNIVSILESTSTAAIACRELQTNIPTEQKDESLLYTIYLPKGNEKTDQPPVTKSKKVASKQTQTKGKLRAIRPKVSTHTQTLPVQLTLPLNAAVNVPCKPEVKVTDDSDISNLLKLPDTPVEEFQFDVQSEPNVYNGAFTSNSETQTSLDDIFDIDEVFNPCSDNCTQTCDELLSGYLDTLEGQDWPSFLDSPSMI